MARPAPVKGESEKVKGLTPAMEPGERHHLRLLLVQPEMILRKPFPQRLSNPSGIPLGLTANDDIVAVAKQGHLSRTPRLHRVFEPRVDHIVREDVREYEATHPSNNLA
jgi:hypothetical protein